MSKILDFTRRIINLPKNDSYLKPDQHLRIEKTEDNDKTESGKTTCKLSIELEGCKIPFNLIIDDTTFEPQALQLKYGSSNRYYNLSQNNEEEIIHTPPKIYALTAAGSRILNPSSYKTLSSSNYKMFQSILGALNAIVTENTMVTETATAVDPDHHFKSETEFLIETILALQESLKNTNKRVEALEKIVNPLSTSPSTTPTTSTTPTNSTTLDFVQEHKH